MDETKLITLVEKCSCIYNKWSRDFKNIELKDKSWLQIATAMNESVENCQRVWRNLRDRYTREKRSIKNISSDGLETIEPAWSLYNRFQFLDPYIKERKRSSHLSLRASGYNYAETVGSASSADNTVTQVVIDTLLDDNKMPTPEPSRLPEEFKFARRASTSSESMDIPLPKPKTSLKTIGNTTRRYKRKAREEEPLHLLESLASSLKEQTPTDSDMAFGQYVGATLGEMSKYKKCIAKTEIVNLLAKLQDDSD